MQRPLCKTDNLFQCPISGCLQNELTFDNICKSKPETETKIISFTALTGELFHSPKNTHEIIF